MAVSNKDIGEENSKGSEKSWLENEMIAEYGRKMKNGIPNGESEQELAVWYNDHVIYPDKVRLNCYYYHHYSFVKDIQTIICTVFHKKMKYAGEMI